MVPDELYDVVADKAAVFYERMGKGVGEAADRQMAGEFTLVSEFETTPFDGMSFHVDKGQSFRFELIDGNQILDIVLLNRHNPADEYASQYHTGTVQGPAPYEGYVFVSSPPYFRPIATTIRDTVDYDLLDARMGAGGRHMFNFSNYRCSESTVELATGTVNANSCNSNLVKAYCELGGDELVAAPSWRSVLHLPTDTVEHRRGDTRHAVLRELRVLPQRRLRRAAGSTGPHRCGIELPPGGPDNNGRHDRESQLACRGESFRHRHRAARHRAAPIPTDDRVHEGGTPRHGRIKVG